MPTFDKAERLVEACKRADLLVATAESCTGGMIAAAITDVSGSSAVFDRGFITYSNQAKQDMLGVSEATLDRFGAVSRQTAEEMALGAISRSRADFAVSVTGIAGPGGGSAEKPVGLVHMGLAGRSGFLRHKILRCGNIGRDAVRVATLENALDMLIDASASNGCGR
ncbi:CinA family protein [Hoeflea sp. WL0058]|uniref:CinA family protein n=2 Tax=Flavimaribacter sediminis TaxID=2865987 RepID=A0AAE2ZM02_9HYPH|nr:CinA family protein [Flavimaribacter sediminis]MBW8636940.1 CinA family protein [Flavimaribacter sediminis]